MEYTNHIMKTDEALKLQEAIESGELVSPYVALVKFEDTGEIFYDNFVPEPAPSTMGTWSDDGEGHYTFEITETDQSYWNDTYIGTINSIEYAGTTDAAEIMLTPGADPGSWDMKIHQENGSETIEQTFEEGTDYMWDDSGFMVDESDSNSTLSVYWDGYGTFTFSSDPENPITITTYDPEYPAGE